METATHYSISLLAVATAGLVNIGHGSQCHRRWKTIDAATGKIKCTVDTYKTTNGTLASEVVEILQSDKGPNFATQAHFANVQKQLLAVPRDVHHMMFSAPSSAAQALIFFHRESSSSWRRFQIYTTAAQVKHWGPDRTWGSLNG